MEAAALERLVRAEPVLLGVKSAAEALALGARELLHSGPPLRDARRPPAVLLSSAVVTILHEGWAGNANQAEAMVAAGEVTLAPAQPRGCVTPLACIVAPGTPLFEVEAGGRRICAPVSAVRGPDTRMGSRDPALAQRLHVRDRRVAPAFHRLLAAHGLLPLLPLAAHGLASGDDLHSRTTAANGELAGWVRGHGEAELAGDLDATPLFFLTLWMAASACMLRAAEGNGVTTLVTRAGGNGEQFAIALAGAPDRWICAEGSAPSGNRLGGREAVAVCAAIGDSAVIDMLGCGGLALAHAAEPLQAFEGHVPEAHASLAGQLLSVRHPLLDRPLWLDAARVVEHGVTPLIALAMLAADGRTGFVGRGLYRPPLSLFERAVRPQSG